MTRRALLAAALIALAALAGACGGSDAPAKPVVSDAWARASAPMQHEGAVYLTITGGSADDRLVGVRAPADVAAAAMIHRTSMADDGSMSMDGVDGVAVPAGATVALAPGGSHVMLMGLAQPLAAGATFDLVLRFEHAGELTAPVEVRAD